MQDDIDEKPVFDKADFMERLDDDISLAEELADLFISDVREKLAILQAAIKGERGYEIESQSHALKGAASNVSGEKLRYIAGLMEAAGKNKDMETVRTLNKRLFSAIDELTEALKGDVLDAARQ